MEKIDLRKIGRDRRRTFLRSRRAQHQYLVSLMRIARHIGVLMKGVDPEGEAQQTGQLISMLERYSELLAPWATATARRMIRDVERRNHKAWMEMSREMGTALREEIESTPTGHIMQELIAAQANEITSLPLVAAKKVMALSEEALSSGERTSTIFNAIIANSDIAEGRARMIARLGVSVASETLTQARAVQVGSEGYIWRTTGGPEVRPDHKALNGKFFRWDDPPIVDKRSGFRSHPGCNAGCMCFTEVVLPARE